MLYTEIPGQLQRKKSFQQNISNFTQFQSITAKESYYLANFCMLLKKKSNRSLSECQTSKINFSASKYQNF